MHNEIVATRLPLPIVAIIVQFVSYPYPRLLHVLCELPVCFSVRVLEWTISYQCTRVLVCCLLYTWAWAWILQVVDGCMGFICLRLL